MKKNRYNKNLTYTLSLRTSPETGKLLKKMAQKKKITLSNLMDEIITSFVSLTKPVK